MSVATHLGIRLRDYDAMIRTFIPDYEEMLDEAASALRLVRRRSPVIVELGIGSGALAERCVAVSPRARVIGLDVDADILALARRRLGPRLTTVSGNFLAEPLPRCDVIVSSFALHHVRTRARKAGIYRRGFRALRPGGLFVSADCCLATDRRQRERDREAWRAHLERSLPPGARRRLPARVGERGRLLSSRGRNRSARTGGLRCRRAVAATLVRRGRGQQMTPGVVLRKT